TVVIWDDSYSTGYERPGTISAFNTSKKLLIDWLGRLSTSDKVMLIRASRGGTTAGNRPTQDHESLKSQVKAVELSDAVAGMPAEFDVTVMNAMDRPQLDVQVTILLDGVVAQTEKLPKVEAGSPQTLTVKVTAPTPGRHLLEARLPGDFLPTDDVRRLMV